MVIVNKRMKKILKTIYRRLKNIERTYEYYEIKKLLAKENFSAVRNEKPDTIKNIVFIIPGMVAHAGGHTSILRLGSKLCDYGYNISYVSYGSQSISEMKKSASLNLEDYKGFFYDSSYIKKISGDVIVATNWRSVYIAKKIPGYKIYFIQDYEPYFYSLGDYYFLAKYTYDMGFHMISLGSWNKSVIEKNSYYNNRKIDVIDFPYEKTEYKNGKRDFSLYKEKKEIKIAVYIKDEEKRLPYISQFLLSNLAEEFKKNGKKLHVLYFGLDPLFKVHYGKNIGKLSKKQLNQLYQNVDFGMVASMTNISLIPYEMIAAGLPIIEFIEGSFSAFFPENSAILTNFNASTLYRRLSDAMINWQQLRDSQINAIKYIQQYSWDKTVKQFADILENIRQ